MGKPTGFLEYERETAKVLPPKVRIANFKEFRTPFIFLFQEKNSRNRVQDVWTAEYHSVSQEKYY